MKKNHKEPVSEEENARQATLEILKILDKYNLSQRQAKIVFGIILEGVDDKSVGIMKVKFGDGK